MRQTTPPMAVPAMAPGDIPLDSVTAVAAASELGEAEAKAEAELEELDSDLEDEGDGVGVGHPIIEGDVRAQPSMGWA